MNITTGNTGMPGAPQRGPAPAGQAPEGGRAWRDGVWQSPDGLALHYRDYPGRADRPPLLCLPGLTRNARDFEPLAAAFAGKWRLIVCEMRGRGESDYARDSSTYTPIQYLADLEALFARLELERVVAIGTSLGGLLSMLLAAGRPAAFAGIVLNDVGPEVDERGLARIREYVGQARSCPTWMHAAWSLRETLGAAYPDFTIADWLRLAKRVMCLGSNERITFDYDMKIAEPFAAPANVVPVDLWPVFGALAGIPVLALRGELSDILSAATLARMARELPGMQAVVVPRVGHAPTLEEPVALAAIGDFLDALA